MTGRSPYRPFTPVLPRAGTVLVSIDSWEFECCAPPVEVGELTTIWTLHFNPTDDDPLDAFPGRTDLWWNVEPWPDPDGPHRRLTRGGLSAVYTTADLPTGRQLLAGRLFGTKHGPGVGFPPATAEVRRLWIFGHQFRGTGLPWRPTLELAGQTPEEFENGPTYRAEGILLELT